MCLEAPTYVQTYVHIGLHWLINFRCACMHKYVQVPIHRGASSHAHTYYTFTYVQLPTRGYVKLPVCIYTYRCRRSPTRIYVYSYQCGPMLRRICVYTYKYAWLPKYAHDYICIQKHPRNWRILIWSRYKCRDHTKNDIILMTFSKL